MHLYNTPMRLAALVVFAFSALIATQTSAKVRYTERTKYYTVKGSTGKELFKQIVRRGPKTSRTRHAIATTQTRLKIVKLVPKIKRSRCAIDDVEIRVDITYTYPRWRPGRKASARLKKNWKKFFLQVRKHETVHGNLSRKYARDLEAQLKRLSGRTSRGCKDFGIKQLKNLARLQRGYVKRQIAFDRREGRARSRIRRLQKTLLRD